ncbi:MULTISPECIES: DoxX family protein [unclassified Microbacterium]|uniref:DoxX family protein n=1 Tax=unclassified Microbacterium TaxID=2609290 RepID=UPI0030193A15
MKTIARWLLAGGMVFAGLSHLFWARKEFQSQVPDLVTEVVPIDKDGVVVASGAVEIMLGAALVVLPGERRRIGAILAAFFVAVFPGNIAQAVERRSAFTLDTDRARIVRLFFQPLLVAWALWSTRDGGRARNDERVDASWHPPSRLLAARVSAARAPSPCRSRR